MLIYIHVIFPFLIFLYYNYQASRNILITETKSNVCLLLTVLSGIVVAYRYNDILNPMIEYDESYVLSILIQSYLTIDLIYSFKESRTEIILHHVICFLAFIQKPRALVMTICICQEIMSIWNATIFKHLSDGQSIHIDGVQVPRYSSLNLPLSGYEKTKMAFYKVINNIEPVISNANYYSKNDVEQIDEFKCKNEWVLVNSGIPHNIQHIDKNNPRVTLCIRFKSNPTLSDLVNRINSSLPC